MKKQKRNLTPKQLENVRVAMRYLWADYETMSTESDTARSRQLFSGIKALDRLIADATPKPRRKAADK